MNNKTLLIFFTLFFTQVGIGNTINSEILKKEISSYNEIGSFDKSIIKLDSIIHSKNVTNYDLYNLYLLKYLTYKTLLNYPEAEENLNVAEKFGLKSSKYKSEVETRVLIERIFIQFDYLKYDKVEELLEKVNKSNLKYLDAETFGFYISVIGTLNSINKNYIQAEKDYLEGIEILKQKSPKHLPNIYRKLLHLYTETKDNKKALEAFSKGLYYAKHFGIKLYILNMYESLTWYYAQNEDWEKAYKTRLIVNDLATDYDAINQSGKLQNLEREIINKRNDLEVRNQKNIRLFLVIISAILIILLIVLYKFYKINIEKRKLVENENERMRNKLSNLINHSNNANQVEKKIILSDYNLSERQLDIIELVKKGFTNKEIATELYISENTVKYHLKVIYNTLGIESRNSL